MIKNDLSIKETNIQKMTIIFEGAFLDITKDYKHTWIDKKGNPYWYEFRGKNFMGYQKPNEVVVLK